MKPPVGIRIEPGALMFFDSAPGAAAHPGQPDDLEASQPIPRRPARRATAPAAV